MLITWKSQGCKAWSVSYEWKIFKIFIERRCDEEFIQSLTRVLENNATRKASKEIHTLKSKYADYNDVVSKTREDLEKCGLMVKRTVSHIDTKLLLDEAYSS